MICLTFNELEREIDILNYYRGEAAKRGDVNADVVQSDVGNWDAMFYLVRKTVTDILLFVNSNRVRMTCDYTAEALCFEVSPVEASKEYMMEILKEAMRQYIVYEVRRLWMMTVRPEWADFSIRGELTENVKKALRNVGGGVPVRRRATDLAGI